MGRLQGQVAIVTGASSGIGQGIAKRLASEGANIVINYAGHGQGAAETLKMVEAAGARGIVVQADVSKVEAVQSLGTQKLNEAVENLKSEQMVSMLESAETLVERVAEVERRKLERMVEKFQSERDDANAHQQWKQIEKMVFGVDYPE